MSRSKQKSPFQKADKDISNKDCRSHANRDLRRKQNILMSNIPYLSEEAIDEIAHIVLREVSDVWQFKSDGLARYTPDTNMRK